MLPRRWLVRSLLLSALFALLLASPRHALAQAGLRAQRTALEAVARDYGGLEGLDDRNFLGLEEDGDRVRLLVWRRPKGVILPESLVTASGERRPVDVIEDGPAVMGVEDGALPLPASPCANVRCAYVGNPVNLERRDGHLRTGSIGWSYAVGTRERPVYRFLSVWHVLAYASNQEPAVVLRSGGNAIGRRVYAEPVLAGKTNFWDLAIGEYDPGVKVMGLRSCPNLALSYPSDVARAPRRDERYYVAGFTGCREGRLAGRADRWISFDGRDYFFMNQLTFTSTGTGPMTSGTDSGAVIFSQDADGGAKAVGLAFAASRQRTYANPLRLRRMKRLGTVKAQNNELLELPLFEDDQEIAGPALAVRPVYQLPAGVRRGVLVRSAGAEGKLEGMVKDVRGPWLELETKAGGPTEWVYAPDAKVQVLKAPPPIKAPKKGG